MRLRPALVPGLAVALAVVAWLADRALVGQAEAARAAAIAGIDEDARLEQTVTVGLPPPGVTVEQLTGPPPRSVAPAGLTPYGDRPRAELAELLASTRATPSGLPEAVVARLALGPAVAVTGAAGSPAVEERLLAGELPVRSEDLRCWPAVWGFPPTRECPPSRPTARCARRDAAAERARLQAAADRGRSHRRLGDAPEQRLTLRA
jgi:hypothetical protein